MAAAPPPIAATVAVSGYTLHTSWSTGLAGHSDPQIPQGGGGGDGGSGNAMLAVVVIRGGMPYAEGCRREWW